MNKRIEKAGDSIAVVGVGASAGGLEALETFFRAVPIDCGLAFVVVQHLSPDFKSHMEELLSRQTSLAVHRVSEGMAINPNTIYLIPPNKELTVQKGHLRLTARKDDRSLVHPIDRFLHSLAEDYGERSIAVILSGTGSDGSRGVVSVHQAGGLVLAQDEATAKFDGMPLSATATGKVDLILPPDAIATAILHYTANGLSKRDLMESDFRDESRESVEKIAHLLHRNYGLDFSQYKPGTIGRRIDRRLHIARCSTIEEYAELLWDDSEELSRLYEDLLIGVTKFFRDPDAFETLRKLVVAKWAADFKQSSARIWCTACASGEEAYSLAMLLDDERRGLERPFDVKIFATDAHSGSLELASRGVYKPDSLESLSPQYRQRYFRKTRDGYQVTRSLRDMIVFAPHNLLSDAPFTQMDMVTCRNMLIYLQPIAQRKALAMFHFSLKANGVLFLGPSESPGELSDEFRAIDHHWRLYVKRRDVRLPVGMQVPVGRRLQPTSHGLTSSAAPRSNRVTADTIANYDQLLAKKMGCSILAGESGEMLHVFNDAGRFLKPAGGRPSNNLLEMIDSSLEQSLTVGWHHAALKGESVRGMIATFNGGESPEELRISIEPLSDGSGPNNFLVSFELTGGSVAAVSPEKTSVEKMNRSRVEGLETELRYSQEKLQSALEEMETSNEELQASNEELVASNEELQSTNEELHSVNEELYTVNAEHQRRVEELARANDDMDNLLATTRVGVIFLDCELYIRRFTPEIARVLDLTPDDLGRPIKDFKDAINRRDLVDELRHVIETQEPLETRVVVRAGTPHLLRALPYRSSDMTEGVVMTLIDITSLTKAESEIELQRMAIESAVNGIIITDPNEPGNPIQYANQGFLNLSGYTREEVIGRNCKFLQCEETDPQAIARIRSALDAREAIRITLLNRKKNGQDFWNDLQITPVHDASGAVRNFVGVQHDITEQVKARQALERASRAAKRANEAKSSFLATMSHELRTPLTSMLGFAEILLAESSDPVMSEKLETIHKNGIYLLALLNDILDLSKIEAGKMRFDRQSVNIRSLLKEVEILMRVRAEEANLSMRFDIDGPLPMDVTADEVRVRQILVNLVGNAIKFTDSGEVVVRAEIDENEGQPRLCISVKDTGIGIAKKQQAKLFEPFHQATRQTTRFAGGTGLGLSICKRLAEGMNGSIEMESKLRKGSRFTLCLPLTKEQLASTASAETWNSRDEIQSTSSAPLQLDAKILLVDDRRDIRFIAKHFLSSSGARVDTAENGEEAIAAVQVASDNGAPYDLVLMDMQMPVMDGRKAVAKLREMGLTTPIIAMTADAMDGERESCIQMGCNDYLPKPIDRDRLTQLIAKFI